MSNKVEDAAISLLNQVREECLTEDFDVVMGRLIEAFDAQPETELGSTAMMMFGQALASTMQREHTIDFDLTESEISRQTELIFNGWTKAQDRRGWYSKIFTTTKDKIDYLSLINALSDITPGALERDDKSLETHDLHVLLGPQAYASLVDISGAVQGRDGGFAR